MWKLIFKIGVRWDDEARVTRLAKRDDEVRYAPVSSLCIDDASLIVRVTDIITVWYLEEKYVNIHKNFHITTILMPD